MGVTVNPKEATVNPNANIEDIHDPRGTGASIGPIEANLSTYREGDDMEKRQ